MLLFLRRSFFEVKLTMFILLLISILLHGVSYANLDNEIKVVLNGSRLEFDVLPIIENGRTMVPMRAIFESLGAEVKWINDTRTIFAFKDNQIITLQVGNVSAFVNSKKILLDVSPTIIDGRTLVPIRFIAESLGAEVKWDDEKRTVLINE